MTGDNLPPEIDHILLLAEIIREVDGKHSLGAAALAEAILSHPKFSWASNLNPERAHMCPEFIYNIKKEKSDD